MIAGFGSHGAFVMAAVEEMLIQCNSSQGEQGEDEEHKGDGGVPVETGWHRVEDCIQSEVVSSKVVYFGKFHWKDHDVGATYNF